MGNNFRGLFVELFINDLMGEIHPVRIYERYFK